MCQKLKTIWSQHYHHQSKVSLQLQKIAPTLRYPSLSPVHPESSVAGNDIFAKFSAWIKCATDHPNYASKSKKLLFSKFFDFFWSKFVSALQQRFIQSLSKLDAFLKTKLSENSEDARLFLDSNRMTLADCNLLPKLHIALTAARHRRNFQLPEVIFQSLKSFLFVLVFWRNQKVHAKCSFIWRVYTDVLRRWWNRLDVWGPETQA